MQRSRMLLSRCRAIVRRRHLARQRVPAALPRAAPLDWRPHQCLVRTRLQRSAPSSTPLPRTARDHRKGGQMPTTRDLRTAHRFFALPTRQRAPCHPAPIDARGPRAVKVNGTLHAGTNRLRHDASMPRRRNIVRLIVDAQSHIGTRPWRSAAVAQAAGVGRARGSLVVLLASARELCSARSRAGRNIILPSSGSRWPCCRPCFAASGTD